MIARVARFAAGAFAALAAIALHGNVIAQPVVADETSDWATEYITGGEKSAATRAACDDFVARSDSLNAPDLLRGANICWHAQRPAEGNFLLAIGQNRFMADAALSMPASQADSKRVLSLYGFVYNVAGGLGDKEVYRYPAAVERLLALYDGWNADYSSEYDSGWQVRDRPVPSEYAIGMAELHASRRADIVQYAAKLSDLEYFQIDAEVDALMAETGGIFEEGSRQAAKLESLRARLDKRSAELGFPSKPSVSPDHVAESTVAENDRPKLSAAPAEWESTLGDFKDDVVRKCARSAQFTAISGGGEILETLVTSDPAWGTIYRADISNSRSGTLRFVCTSNSTLSRPLDMGDDVLTPLN